ncbi:hypothetical protein M514_05123 [Trichuris suis]|uniref:E3 SUMO-protein ligase NSE2 n=1 Tax=Trichuris suis TaxID=68888 RepID=A0A085N0N1_9BILA|nr:hypothetical protein M514_05123 [Trichuris suis]
MDDPVSKIIHLNFRYFRYDKASESRKLRGALLFCMHRDSYTSNSSTEIDSLINELDDVARDLLTQIQLTCESFASGNCLQPEHDFNELRKILSSALVTKQEIAIDKSIVQRMKGLNGDSERMHQLIQDYAGALQQLTNPEDMHEFKKFNATYEQMGEASCAWTYLVLETPSNGVVIDPITKKAVVNPVRNIHCGHVYEKEAIESLLSIAEAPLKCAWFGCKNTMPLKLEDLRPVERSTCIVLCAVFVIPSEADYDGKLCPHELDKSYFGFKSSEGMCVTFSKQEGQGSYDIAGDKCRKLFHGTLYNIFSVSLPNPTYRVGEPVSKQYELLFNHSLPPVDRLPIYKHDLVILNGIKIIRMHSTRSKKTISSRLMVRLAGELQEEIAIDIKNYGSSSLNLMQSKLIIDQTEQQYMIQGAFSEAICLYLKTEWVNARQQYKWNVPGSCRSTPFDGYFCSRTPFQWCTVFNKTDDAAYCECSPGPEKVKCTNVPCNVKESFVGFNATKKCVGKYAFIFAISLQYVMSIALAFDYAAFGD